MVSVDKVVRSELGTLAFSEAVEILSDLKKKIAIARLAPEKVSQQALDNMTAALNNIAQQFQQLEKAGNTQFPQQKQTVIQQIRGSLDQLATYWAPVLAVAIEKLGILDGSAALKEELSQMAVELSKELKEAADGYLKAARKEAEKITNRAQDTAAGISVKAAQDQFDAAQKKLNWKAGIWTSAAAVAFCAFFWFAAHVLRNPPIFEGPSSFQVLVATAVYRTAIRLTILTAIVGLGTFMLKMARAHFHMAEYNEHRRRVANSMSAFVEAARSQEQRDLILGKLVEAVVQFGDSGILEKEKDSPLVPSVSIDAIMKAIPQSKAIGG